MPHTMVVICRQASVNGHYSLSYMSRITCLLLWSFTVISLGWCAHVLIHGGMPPEPCSVTQHHTVVTPHANHIYTPQSLAAVSATLSQIHICKELFQKYRLAFILSYRVQGLLIQKFTLDFVLITYFDSAYIQ